MEYVYKKAMRASGFEAIKMFSGCNWQQDLCYYELSKDVLTIQCIHAPELTARTEGIRVNLGR